MSLVEAVSVEFVEVDDALLSVLDLRLLNGKDGTRYVGKSVGGEGICGKEGIVG